MPDTGKATKLIGQQMQVLHNVLSADHSPRDPTVEPFKPVDFAGSFTLNALIACYDRMQRKDGSTPPAASVFSVLWDQYDQDVLNRRTFDGTQRPADHQARAMLHGGDRPSGLRLTGIKLSDQISGAETFIENYGEQHRHTNAAAMNTADLVIVNAQRQVEDHPLLDNDGTFTRVPQLETKPVGGGSCVGGVDSLDGQLGLHGSFNLTRRSYSVVRFSLGPEA